MGKVNLTEIIHIITIIITMMFVLSAVLLFVHFFTRRLKNMIHRVAIFCITIGVLGFTWHILISFIYEKVTLAHIYISDFLWIILFCSFGYLCNRLVDKYVWQVIYVQNEQKMATTLLKSTIATFIYLVCILLVISLVFKKDVQILATFLTGSGLILGYAGSDIIKELFAGVALNVNPAFKKGDFLQIKERQAKIVDINWRYVVLEDIDANRMYIPNTDMIRHIIYNYSGTIKPTRIVFTFHTHPNVPPQLVIDLITPKLKQLPYLAPADWFEDNVVIHVKECAIDSIQFEAHILIEKFDYSYEIKTNAYKLIWYTLHHHQIPLYAYTMLVEYDKKEYDQVSNVWHKRLRTSEIEALLKAVPIFDACADSDIKTLADHVQIQEFLPSQPLFSVGDSGDSLFIIASGTVQLTKPTPQGKVLVTKHISAGNAVGINAVLTGGKRMRSAIAKTHVLAYEINRSVLNPIIQQYPKRIHALADQIIKEEHLKEQEFEAYLKKRTAEQSRKRASLIGQIRAFLGIADAPDL